MHSKSPVAHQSSSDDPHNDKIIWYYNMIQYFNIWIYWKTVGI